jgi:hypothetical protein
MMSYELQKVPMKYPTLALLALSVACASSQRYDGTRTEEDSRLCLKAGPCTVRAALATR